MKLLTDEEVMSFDVFEYSMPDQTILEFARAIESAVLAKIKANGAVAWLDTKGYAWTQTIDGIENITPLYAIGKEE